MKSSPVGRLYIRIQSIMLKAYWEAYWVGYRKGQKDMKKIMTSKKRGK